MMKPSVAAYSNGDDAILFWDTAAKISPVKWLTENPQDWADHHHLAGTTAQVKAKQRGNYTSFLMDPQTTA